MANFGVNVVESAIKRIKRLCNIDTDLDLCEYLGVSRQTVYKWKQRGSIDLALIKEKIEDISIDYILFGVGEPFIKKPKMFTDFNDVAKEIGSSIPKVKNTKVFKEPIEEYKTGNEERNRIPIVGGRVSAGKPLDVFDSITGYFYTDSIATNSTCILQMFVDTYEEHGIRKGDMLVIDTKATPKDCSYIVFADAEKYKVGNYRIDKDVTKYIDLESGKEVVVNKDNLAYIIGVIKTRIRDY